MEKGMSHGQKVGYRGEGDEAPGMQPGDVIVVLEQAVHEHFVRRGNHLFYKKKITLLESLTGFTHYIEHLDGRVLKVSSSNDTVYEPGYIKSLREEGMPQEKQHFLRGDLYIEYEVIFPEEAFSAAQKAALGKVLPKSKPEQMPESENEPEEVTLTNVDIAAEQRKWQEEKRQRGEQYDEDEGSGHGRQASCKAQ